MMIGNHPVLVFISFRLNIALTKMQINKLENNLKVVRWFCVQEMEEVKSTHPFSG
jgi:hypothetical protein